MLKKQRMSLSKLHPHHFWSDESSLTSLLIFTLGYLIVLNSLSEFSFGRLAARLFFSLIIVAGVFTTFKHRWLRGFALVLAVASLALNWAEEIRPGGGLTTLNVSVSLIYMAFLLAIVINQVFREGPVTGHRIRGAILIYLLLGGLWAMLYQVVALTMPHAFRLPEGMGVGDPDVLQRTLTYFSFITITTTGYGDITPIHPLARTLCMLEALVGQLYPAITLARLVSLAVMHQKENP
ncbi:potassium channel family protein [Desulfobacca acetoxidans]|uniref:Ion transport 2 domain protein n=1 Tax=Desulfobacca acetoxidans (strain ATCC 700848 / DSM 11109 / ASRB2) TaxID=880072 RepID=F2NFT5_DESAR|nr:potassium channel family protein [Desulfobacca acetoxidans]AEB10204.1 Ion transport 2 domain protein [Desulfobacca acetoxidans DSM 11109]